jgi:phosphate starvation-inducible PhoH-like protein
MLSCGRYTSNAFICGNRRYISKTSTLHRATKKATINLEAYEDESFTHTKIAANYKPRGDNQQTYVTSLQNQHVPIVIGVGPAGSGKTLFACLQAIQDLQSDKVDKIVLTRPIVPVEEEELGFLPGNLVKKMDPWTRPIFDIFSEYYKQRDIEKMIHSGILEISPLAYMRGRTFKRSFIIADEMQNSTPNQMLMLTTRIGEQSKMVITGDLKQSDRTGNNGLLDIMHKLTAYRSIPSKNDVSIHMVELNATDIQRSPIVSQIISIYNNEQLISVGSNSLSIFSRTEDISNENNGLTNNKTPISAVFNTYL